MRSQLTLGLSTLILSFGLAAHASSIITAGGITVVPNGGTTPGSASNYDLFGYEGPTPSVLTDFTVALNGGVSGGGSEYGYTQLAVPGGSTAYATGFGYVAGDGEILTITSLNGGNFILYVLSANQDANSFFYTSSLGLASSEGTETVITSTYQHNTNQFTIFDVKGATAGETFELYAHGSGYPSIGGVSIASTPEPSSFVLLGTGVLGALGAARRRFAKS